jgi:hypothetical protein
VKRASAAWKERSIASAAAAGSGAIDGATSGEGSAAGSGGRLEMFGVRMTDAEGDMGKTPFCSTYRHLPA